jgi:hypothetical protein
LNRLNKTKVFGSQNNNNPSYEKAKDGETMDKDGKIIKVIDKIKMASLVEMDITETTIT